MIRPIAPLIEGQPAAKRCDRCKNESATVRWVGRIGAWLCGQCRRDERQYSGRK